MKLSEQLIDAIDSRQNIDTGMFIVRVVKFDNENFPGQSLPGVLPILVVGHASMDQAVWTDWIVRHGLSAYPGEYLSKLATNGISMKEFMPSATFGRSARAVSGPRGFEVFNYANAILVMAEKWPSIYNAIVDSMTGQEMTIRAFVDRVMQLPKPFETGDGRDFTLGDILVRDRNVISTPNF